ncbi:ATPase synthesis protein 25 mitochondrial [Monascus purpureus]|uniref:ATPase synthesis protein 25 n=1 Tax=Monascus purpureus TaxID=5098 RepID=A0A507R7B4_MONPU|nr:ATPase synthesis protein 25 mitochondrial [Monascus purpureus]BDD55298.1 hypothetical protein MAP00_000835 [Monascus purpureus]
MQKAVALKAALCHSCRQEVLRSFVSVSGVSIPRYSRLPGPIHNANRRRAFTLAPRLLSKEESRSDSDEVALSVDGTSTHVESDVSQPTEHIPWYLQEETLSTEPHPLFSRDQIPDLPANPPEILPVLLEYIFKDLGLDNLKLLDLRGLDNPPALGANVIMIIGTARSVKHLNVSADRLCRWLRSTWKLSPHADGLLGRNELKIKLRRKARRARIASKAGALVDEKDDGITTGWICVNAGLVEDKSVQQQPTENLFEGFGITPRGTRIVVQIFTEEKRAEVDLEALWEAALERANKRIQANSEVDSDSAFEKVRGPTGSTPDSDLGHPPKSSVTISLEQKRGLHTTRRIRALHSESNIHVMWSGTESRFFAGASSIQGHILSQKRTITVTTSSLLQLLSEIPKEEARRELGEGPDDRASTLFLRLFHGAATSAEEAAASQIRLICMGISLQHPAYDKERLYNAFEDHICAGYPLPEELGFQVFSTMLSEYPILDSSADSPSRVTDADKELAWRIIDHLSFRGVNVLNMQVFDALYKAANSATCTELSQISEQSRQASSLISRAIEALNIPLSARNTRSFMIHAFQNRDYDNFWKIWHRLPLHSIKRTAEDYAMLFRLHAELGDHRRARDCITWVDMMQREDPPVRLEGQVAQHVESCRRLASEGYMSLSNRAESRDSVAM